MKNFLKIENFSCGYSKSAFKVEEINITTPKGSFIGILGKNGSGKSTLFKGLMGDIPLFSGKVLLYPNENDCLDLLSLAAKKRAQYVAIVSQFVELAPISVEEYVLMGRTPYRKPFQFTYSMRDIAIADKYMELTGITYLKDKLITELSGGEQQMVNIASALTQQPKLLLLDEPTSHLDIAYQLKIMDLLRMLNETEGLTVIMIIHDLNLSGEYCTHLTLMKNGKALYQGAPEDVLTYSNIEDTFDTTAVVQQNPISGKPLVFPISKKKLEEHKRILLSALR